MEADLLAQVRQYPDLTSQLKDVLNQARTRISQLRTRIEHSSGPSLSYEEAGRYAYLFYFASSYSRLNIV